MSVVLLDKTRKIGKLLHNNNSSKVVFNDICAVLTQILDSETMVISKKGKLLGIAGGTIEPLKELVIDRVGGFIDTDLNERLLSILSTKENVNLETLGFEAEEILKYSAIISPIDIAGERQGTLFVYRKDQPYNIDDIILCEYGATVVGLEMVRSLHEEYTEESRKVKVVKSAMSSLTYSEAEAIRYVFKELNDKEGLLVASRLADRVGITRSVIVNALKKIESAGVIETHSSGMKGTYIKVLNDALYSELAYEIQ